MNEWDKHVNKWIDCVIHNHNGKRNFAEQKVVILDHLLKYTLSPSACKMSAFHSLLNNASYK